MKSRSTLPDQINLSDLLALYRAEAGRAELPVVRYHILHATYHIRLAFAWHNTPDGPAFWAGVFERLEAMLEGSYDQHKLSSSSNGHGPNTPIRTPLPLSTEMGGSTPPGDTRFNGEGK